MAGNIVVTEHPTFSTHLGEWMGIPPTGKEVNHIHLDIWEFEGRKLKKLTTYADISSIMIQLGVMPASELPSLEPSFELPDPEPTGLSPLEANAEFIIRWNTHDLAHWVTMARSDVEFKYNTAGMLPLNREQGVGLNELFALANSTLRGEIVHQVDMGDGWVVAESVWSGVNDGPYFGIPASGNPVVVRAASVAHFDTDGLVTSFHFYFDNLGVLVQMGVVPAP